MKLEDREHEDLYTCRNYYHDANTQKEKVLNGISIEKMFKLEFNYINETKTFYNMYANVTRFSIRKDDLKWDKNGLIVSQKWVCSREGHRLAKCSQNEN